MNDELFAELMASIEEAGQIAAGRLRRRGPSPSNASRWM